jgi:CDP-diacylglycerol--glycerol-3-phosphate 3-phosphatidyltransferase
MNLPNKLTMLRIILIPVMIAVYLFAETFGVWTYVAMGVIYVVASYTDHLDGKIARKRNMVTTFGKFMDPLADKLLVLTAIIILSDASARGLVDLWMPFWVPIVIFARELIVTSIRLVAVGEGTVIAASGLGKAKTALTMGATIYYFFVLPWQLHPVLNVIGIVLMAGAVLLTLISGADYFWKNRKTIFASV